MEPNILATWSLNAKRTFPWRASTSGQRQLVFTQAAQQPAPIPEVNALAFSLAGPRTRALDLDLVFLQAAKRKKRGGSNNSSNGSNNSNGSSNNSNGWPSFPLLFWKT